jgi:hypothetical protein
MKTLTITWTDIFYGIGDFCQWCFKGMRALGQGPNIIISTVVILLLAYWTIKIMQQNKEADRNGTYK